MWTMLEDRITGHLRSDPSIKSRLRALEASVGAGKLSPALAVDEIAQQLGV